MRAMILAMMMTLAGATDAVAQDAVALNAGQQGAVPQAVACDTYEAGEWRNNRPAMRQLSRLEIEADCIENAAVIRVRAHMRCAPRDCKWGWSEGVRIGHRIVADFNGFFGSRKVSVTAMGDRMEAMVSNFPHDPTANEEHYSVILVRN